MSQTCIALAVLTILNIPTQAEMHPAQRYRAGGEPVRPAADGSFFCEAEEFQVLSPGWQAKDWGRTTTPPPSPTRF